MYNDGAAALVLVSGEKAKNFGLQVLARIRGYADAAQAPQLFIEGGDSAFFASRGSVFLGFVRATRRGPGLLHVSCNKGDREADYRGPVGVVLLNHSEADFAVKPGDRCAQMIVQVIATPEVAEVEDLDATVRGEVHRRLNSEPW